MKKCIVSLLIGKKYSELWNKYSKKSWEEYAARFNYDLILFDKPFDSSKRATDRSPAWQKCLILKQKETSKYDQVVWLDSDIIINTVNSPDICNSVPIDKIGGTNAYELFNSQLFDMTYEHWKKIWLKSNSKAIINSTPNSFYQNFGIHTEINEVIHTGVLVLSPEYHNEILEKVYYNYEDKGNSIYNYEMRPLSFEIVKAKLHYWIDYRFNLIFSDFRNSFYPYLNHIEYSMNLFSRFKRKLCKIMGCRYHLELEQLAATTAYTLSYFIHFAGCYNSIEYVNQDIKRPDQFILKY